MIGKITGKVSYKENIWLILDTGNVGYKIFVEKDLHAQTKENEEVSLWTYLAVRENSLDLYGFQTTEKLKLFELLISVSGIGPKSALSILDVASPSSLRQAVVSGETSPLTEVAGIGKKNAEKIIIELRGKLKLKEGEVLSTENTDSEVYEALTSLGYSAKDARDVISKLPNKDENTHNRIKAALKIIGS
jgi:Holliday junction DNA helicase RuvA